MTSKKQEIEFASGGDICRAWYFKADTETLSNNRGVPCVVMGHGFGGTRRMSLEQYALRFADAGMDVVVFDYRHFGDSEGEPRQLISIKKQHEDYLAALRYVRSLEGVDDSRVAIWGTSFAGGHVVEVAVQDGDVAAAVSQCPMMDGLTALKNLLGYTGIFYLLALTGHGIVDVIKSVLGMQPKMLPIVAEPGELAAMSTPDAMPGYLAISPPDIRNEVCARIALTVGMYRPGLKAGKLPCPILIQVCENDSVAPADAAVKTAERAGQKAHLVNYPIGHFDIYLGDDFERSVTDQVAFLTEILAVK